MIQISVYVPADAKEKVKAAMFEAGGGKLGLYDSCSFEYQGIGQFRPLPGSHPSLGKVGAIETVAEVKIEMMCEEELASQVVRALKASHPYEMPAYYVIKTLGI